MKVSIAVVLLISMGVLMAELNISIDDYAKMILDKSVNISKTGTEESAEEGAENKTQQLQKKIEEARFELAKTLAKNQLAKVEKKAEDETKKAEVKENAKEEVLKKFAGLNWGVGVSWILDVNSNRVEEAEVVNGLVRVKEKSNVGVRLLAETHYFFAAPSGFYNNETVGKFGFQEETFHWGPFVAIATEDFRHLDGAGGGLMFGFRNKKTDNTFNIGIGWMVDSKQKELGKDIKENEPLPEGETEIRYLTKSQGGLAIITSFSF